MAELTRRNLNKLSLKYYGSIYDVLGCWRKRDRIKRLVTNSTQRKINKQ